MTGFRVRLSFKVGLLWLLLVAGWLMSACQSQLKWEADPRLVVPAGAVARVLAEGDPGPSSFDPELVPPIPQPSGLRPCCALGSDLRVALGAIPVPGIRLSNVIGLEELGPHNYDNGTLAFEGSYAGAPPITAEKNGLVYTCRGGFVDTAHVRDYADWTVFFVAAVARHLLTGGVIELPSEGARRRAVIRPLDASFVERHGALSVVVPMAAWLSFQISIWHEIATWYGWHAIRGWPEELSAFSPEDVFSNVLGIRIAAGLIEAQATPSEDVYNHNMTWWIHEVLRDLDAVSPKLAREALAQVDGVWWDSHARLPSRDLVRRRSIAIGSTLAPWLASDVAPEEDPSGPLAERCSRSRDRAVLPMPEELFGIPIRDIATLEIEVGEALSERFRFPRPEGRWITQEDFPRILRAVRAEAVEFFGPAATLPHRSPTVEE